MTNVLGAKPVVDTSEFKKGLTDMNRSLRVLDSSFKASAAALGDWAESGEGLEMRIGHLNKSIDIQRQKTAALRNEFERIRAEKGADAAATQKAEIEYNNAAATLGKMENELKQTERALDEMGKETRESGNEAGKASQKYNLLGDAMKGIAMVAKLAAAAIAALAMGLVAVGIGIGKMVFGAASAAAELVDLSMQTGLSTTRLQELQFVGSQVGTDLDTMTSSLGRLIRSMGSAKDGTGAQAEAFKELGISVKDSNGNLRSSDEVFGEVIDALGQIENETEADALAMTIFGKSAMELNPLIRAGADEMARLSSEAHKLGAVMSEEDVAALEAFDDTVAALKLSLKGTIGTLAGVFLPGFQAAFGQIGGYVQRFAGIVQNYAGTKNFAPGLVSLFGDIFKDIAEQAPQMIQAGMAIVEGLIKSISAALPSLLNSGQSILGTLLTAIVQNLPLLLDVGMKAITALLNGLAAAAPTMTPKVIEILGQIALVFLNNLEPLLLAGWELMKGIARGLVNAVPDESKRVIESLLTNMAFSILRLKAKLQDIGKQILAGVRDGILGNASAFYDDIIKFFTGIVEAVKRALGIQSPSKVMFQQGVMVARGFGLGVLSEMNSIQTQLAGAFGSLTFAPALMGGGGAATVVNSGATTNLYVNGLQLQNAGPQTTMADIMDFLNQRQ